MKDPGSGEGRLHENEKGKGLVVRVNSTIHRHRSKLGEGVTIKEDELLQVWIREVEANKRKAWRRIAGEEVANDFSVTSI